MITAAMTVGAFNGLVRVADATGIPADEGMLAYSAADRAALGIDAFPGGANSDLDLIRPEPASSSVTDMFVTDT